MADPKRVRAQAAADAQAAAKWKRVHFRDNRDPATLRPPLMVGTPDDKRCWCLEPLGHDWPGKDDGAPHPRNTPKEND
ncbi:hypothetical protein [Streptomyces sp. T028]|uniref:hypothetical protein n=1 Tax=Streptomyces sp. T028 TaxID=3394379 RepID=UPI003A879964